MKLVIIRHGIAGDREDWEAQGHDDRLRPLTPEGRKEMQRVAPGLARLVPSIDVLATSPLARAAETAEIVAREYHSETVSLEALATEHNPGEVVRWLREQPPNQTVGVVGHEPQLSQLAGYLLTGTPASFIDLKKGGACRVDLPGAPKPGDGCLEWLLTPRELRRLGK
ncbi:MAG: histidine phosphatase family protein [Gemmatimonadota bacterium]|nr:histidine phosphatase family protein [Gemmatimonadota bacterium]